MNKKNYSPWHEPSMESASLGPPFPGPRTEPGIASAPLMELNGTIRETYQGHLPRSLGVDDTPLIITTPKSKYLKD